MAKKDMMIPKEKISPDSTKQSRNCVTLCMNTCFNTEMYFYVTMFRLSIHCRNNRQCSRISHHTDHIETSTAV